jgi:choline dehydrogenase
MEIVIEEIRFMRRFMASQDFTASAPVETAPGLNITSDADLAAWVRRVYTPTLYHPIGTAAKMPRELGGVVGEDLLVHATEKLSVVDASIMPAMPGGPTSQTVYMIAEKVRSVIPKILLLLTCYQAADLIKARQ